MAIRGIKNNPDSLIPLVLKLNKGLNLSGGAASIDQDELWRLENFIYDAQSKILKSRPGLNIKTTLAAKFADPIRALYYYRKDSTTAYWVCASGTKLYYLSGAGLDAWTEIGSLTDSTTVPAFETFHNKLIIADGGTDLRTWDGTTYTTIANSPQATALAVIKGRLVANNTDDFDLVSMSALNDETTWSGGTSVAIRCGYGDGMNINGFAVAPGGNDLIVSKVTAATGKKVLYRINVVDATTANWYSVPVSTFSAAYSAHTMISSPNDVFFADTDGLKSLRGIQEYGDMATNYVGGRINTIFEEVTPRWMAWIPGYSAMALIAGNYTYLYFPFNDTFSKLYFMAGRMECVFEGGGKIYFGGYDGYLYYLDSTLSVDYTAPGATSAYSSFFETKRFDFMSGLLLRRTQVHLTPVVSGTATLYAVKDDTSEVALKTITLVEEGEFLFDATDDLYDAEDDLYYSGAIPWFEISHNKVRANGLSFKVLVTSGRIGINELKAEIVLVRGN